MSDIHAAVFQREKYIPPIVEAIHNRDLDGFTTAFKNAVEAKSFAHLDDIFGRMGIHHNEYVQVAQEILAEYSRTYQVQQEHHSNSEISILPPEKKPDFNNLQNYSIDELLAIAGINGKTI